MSAECAFVPGYVYASCRCSGSRSVSPVNVKGEESDECINLGLCLILFLMLGRTVVAIPPCKDDSWSGVGVGICVSISWVYVSYQTGQMLRRLSWLVALLSAICATAGMSDLDPQTSNEYVSVQGSNEIPWMVEIPLRRRWIARSQHRCGGIPEI